jgi:hypothetical protein
VLAESVPRGLAIIYGGNALDTTVVFAASRARAGRRHADAGMHDILARRARQEC